MMALATRYDVSAQVDSSIVADRLPAMCGSETFTTVVSSTSMNVANMTATATIQGLTCRSDIAAEPGRWAFGFRLQALGSGPVTRCGVIPVTGQEPKAESLKP